ncbi:MAG: MFS transporter, partial [Planctomycetaceae bacterium]|nr:MFS transporter [Planctomycetaceae bacterium]
SAMIGDLANSAQRPHAFGLMYVAFNLGFSVAAPLGGFLSQYSFQWLFWGDAATTALYGLMILMLISETLPAAVNSPAPDPHHDDAAPRERSGISATATSSGNGFVPWRTALQHMIRDRIFVMFCMATVLTVGVFMQAFSTLPLHMAQLGYSENNIGWLMSTNGILIVLCQVPVTHLLSRFERLSIIIVGELLIAFGFGLTALASTTLFLFFTIVLWTLGEVVQAAFKQSMVADLAPPTLRGRYMGVFGLCHAVGITIGAPVGGYVLDRWTSQVLWPACCLVVLAATMVYVVTYFDLRKRNEIRR